MPTALRIGPYRFYFYSNENDEPPHVHVDRDKLSVKYWLNPVSLARNFGFNSRELREIEESIGKNEVKLLEAWNDHFGTGN